jgi:hypothetical protein
MHTHTHTLSVTLSSSYFAPTCFLPLPLAPPSIYSVCTGKVNGWRHNACRLFLWPGLFPTRWLYSITWTCCLASWYRYGTLLPWFIDLFRGTFYMPTLYTGFVKLCCRYSLVLYVWLIRVWESPLLVEKIKTLTLRLNRANHLGINKHSSLQKNKRM